MKEKVAIIGTGIAGMSCAHFLQNDCDITVYEELDRIGGHTNTIEFTHDGENIVMDTGFMVFNEVTYPNLIKLFEELDVKYTNTDMGFSVWDENTNLQFNGSGLSGLFADKKNIFNISYIKMLFEINRFNKEAPNLLAEDEDPSLKEYLNKNSYSDDFANKYLIPMSSAVWSTPANDMLSFPAKTLIRFFYNHGFLGLNTQYQWKTCINGSRSYRDKIIESFKDKIRTGSPVKEVEKSGEKVFVRTKDHEDSYDRVIIASHGDQAISMIKRPGPKQINIMSHFKTHDNIAIVHTDESVMSPLKSNWSSWNYIRRADGENYTVYYMNSLQNVSQKNNFFININGEKFIDPNKVIQKINYRHPAFDRNAIEAQVDVQNQLNLRSERINFVGAYLRYGFHEDGLYSSRILCEKLLGKEVL